MFRDARNSIGAIVSPNPASTLSFDRQCDERKRPAGNLSFVRSISMFSRLRKSVAIVPTAFALTLSFAGIGCGGGETAPAPANAGSEKKDAASSNTSAKAKTKKGVASEDEAPARKRDKD